MNGKWALIAALVLGGLLLAQGLAPSAQKEKEKEKEARASATELAKAKLEAAQRTCLALAQEYLENKATLDQVHGWSRRWMDAQREVSSKRSDQQTAAEAHVSRMRQLEKAAQDKYDARRAPASEVAAAEYHRIEAEQHLARVKNSR